MAVNITSHSSILSSSLNLYDDQKEERSLKMRQLGLTEDRHGEVHIKDMGKCQIKVDFNEEEQQVSSSIQNLMEYREAPASPSASSVTESASIENIGSPPASPPSPPSQAAQDMDDERLPNELLDEICEDIGMKEGMELDFVEFLMEQDIDPQVYMTPEAIKQFGLGGISTSSSQTVTPSTPVSSKTSDELTMNRGCESPTNCSVSSSTNVTVATSSGSSSPASKRFHSSTSTPTSPLQINTSHCVFKAPKTPPTPRRTPATNQCAASPSSLSSSHSKDSSGSVSNAPTVQISSPQMCKSQSQSQQPAQGLLMVKPSSQNCQPQVKAATSVNQKLCAAATYQRLGRQAPPNVNVQNMQQPQQPQQQLQARWIGQMSMQNGMMVHGQNPNQSSCAMAGSGYRMQMQQQYGRTLESPLDQGYFSNDTASVRSYESTVSSSVTPKMAPAISTTRMHPIAHKQMQMRGQVDSSTMQKSVHFADVVQNCDIPPIQRQLSNDMSYGGQYSNISDCDSEMQKSVPSKILTRLNHNVKCGNSPYMRPINSASMSPYNDYDVNHQGDGSSPVISMQPYDFTQKSEKQIYSVDNNQNMMQMGNLNTGMNSGQRMQNGGYQERQSSCDGDPMSLHNMGTFSQSQCDMQQLDPSKGTYYGPMQNNSYKSVSQESMPQMGTMQLDSGQYCTTPHGNMNGSCGMMGINPAKRHMPTSACPAGPGFQQQGQNYGQSACSNNTVSNSSMHMHAVGMANQQGNPSGYDPNMYNQDNRMQGPGMYQNQSRPNPQASNMASSLGTPQSWACPTSHNPQMKDMQNNISCQSKTIGMYPMMPQQPDQMSMPQGPHPVGQCTTPNCANCKSGSPNRPPILASQQTFIQHLITDRSSAFRSHPLFPLLRDLIIADMNFASPSFPYQLISNLPVEFDKLLQNFLHRNPPAGDYQENYAVESVIMDALKYAHHCLIEKIKVKQDQEKQTKTTSKSISAIEEFCEKFDQSVRNSIIKPPVFQINSQGNAAPSQTMLEEMSNHQIPVGFQTPSKQMDSIMMPGIFITPPAKKMLNMQSLSNSPDFKMLKDFDGVSDMNVASSTHNGKTESKKHPSLPKEAVAIMLEWLRQHKDNPYPNDDEKAMLIKQTGLTINQINYWFTNARRRILPKWAQQCK